MTIYEILVPILTTGAFAVVGFLLKKVFVDRIDKLEGKVDELKTLVYDLKTSNQNEHAEMEKEIAIVKERMKHLDPE